ncbi:MAG TPA: sigma-54 dependent transcriptional regulator [Candidatus Binatia bacterium]|nr:sigma-54 dependent transcriptional regulator [Candidatus Binatia bacterium]
MKNILVAEDDRTLRDGLVQSMSKSGYKVHIAQSGKDALERIEKQVFDLVISGHRIGGADGLEILRKARSTNAGTLVIVTGENGSGAVEAMKSGAFDYLQKPLSLEAIEMKVQRAMEHQRLVVRLSSMTEPHTDPTDRYGLVGQSGAMREIFKMIDKVAASNATVLIQGETGTGKERVAEAIHRNSPRHDAAFVRMNCASLPDNLLESELFGHEKGAFTGADQMRIGRFEMANDGTLFLDEVGNMSANTQAKVLRAIQNQEFERLGGNRTIKVDVRIVAATNINLEAAIKEGRFREDLFYRLNVVNIMVPALRERVEDIVPLAEHFIKRFARELRRKVTGFSADAVKALQEYRWPGNVRELENSIERAVLMCEGDVVRPADLTLLDREHSIGMTPALAADLLNLEALEKTALLEALKRSNWIQKEAAKLLGVSSRVMNYKVHKHGITHDRWSKNRN